MFLVPLGGVFGDKLCTFEKYLLLLVYGFVLCIILTCFFLILMIEANLKLNEHIANYS